MKKLLTLILLATLFGSCSSEDDGESVTPTTKSSVKFDKKNISLKYGESLLIGIDKPIKECNFSIDNDYYTSVSINGDEAKLNALKVGKTCIFVSYKEAKDTCYISIEPLTSSFGKPMLDLGESRDSVKAYMKDYQQGGSVGGYTGLSYNFNTSSKVYYQFDNTDKLIAIKQELDKSKYSLNNIQTSLKERFNPISNSTTVYWYSAPKIMVVRVENTVSKIIIYYAKDADMMFNYFPW